MRVVRVRTEAGDRFELIDEHGLFRRPEGMDVRHPEGPNGVSALPKARRRQEDAQSSPAPRIGAIIKPCATLTNNM